jgi:putative transposase
MKKSRFSERQIIAILKQAEAGAPVPELCRDASPARVTMRGGSGKVSREEEVLTARRHQLCQSGSF